MNWNKHADQSSFPAGIDSDPSLQDPKCGPVAEYKRITTVGKRVRCPTVLAEGTVPLSFVKLRSSGMHKAHTADKSEWNSDDNEFRQSPRRPLHNCRKTSKRLSTPRTDRMTLFSQKKSKNLYRGTMKS